MSNIRYNYLEPIEYYTKEGTAVSGNPMYWKPPNLNYFKKTTAELNDTVSADEETIISESTIASERTITSRSSRRSRTNAISRTFDSIRSNSRIMIKN